MCWVMCIAMCSPLRNNYNKPKSKLKKNIYIYIYINWFLPLSRSTMTLACGISCQFCGRWEQPSEPTPATQSRLLLWESSGTWTYQSWLVWQKTIPPFTVSAAVICGEAGQWLKSSDQSFFSHWFYLFRLMKTSRYSWAWSRTSFQESNSIKPATRS